MSARERVAALSLIPFDAAAMYSASLLNMGATADFRLTPGDATVYCFIIVPPKIEFTFLNPEGDEAAATTGVRKDFIVAAGAGHGEGVYPWSGQDGMDGDYVAGSWGLSHLHTGWVVARFLNALSPYLDKVDDS